MTDQAKCSAAKCANDARCAIKTARPTRDKMTTTIYWDERTAPKAASPYCKPCALALIPSLAAVLIDNG